MSERHYVDVIAFKGEERIRRMGPFTSERAADRVDRGVNINLDHDLYFTRIDSIYVSEAGVASAVKGLIDDVERSRNE